MHPNQETLKGMMENAGFEQVTYTNMTGGIVALHKGLNSKMEAPSTHTENQNTVLYSLITALMETSLTTCCLKKSSTAS